MRISPSCRSLGWLALAFAVPLDPLSAEELKGLILPRDNEGMVLRNGEGRFEVEWTSETVVALMTNTRQFGKGLSADRLEYAIHSSKEVVTFPIPTGPITGIKTTRGNNNVDRALVEAKDENWIAEHGLALHFGREPEKEQLASTEDPRFIGTWDPTTKPRTLSINGKQYEISLKKGGQATIPLYGILTVKDLKPFVNKATVIGERKGNILIANEIRMQPIGDQAAHDDPKLPRYLFIGDSISGNYTNGLRDALEGKFNLHHPPTNCGPSAKGAKEIVDWLGAYDQPGRHWDVISFNFGHWDSGNDKAGYQANLEKVIAELKKTGAKLIWVTTCPVPNGYEPVGPLDDRGKAPGRTAGVMEKFLNPWAAEVMARHPEIAICDQWQFVKDNAGGLYADWWAGKNVHFGGEPADALGRRLAETVLETTEGAVSAITREQADEYDLDPAFFKKGALVRGILIATSDRISDFAILESAYLFNHIMSSIDPEVADRIRQQKVLCILVGHDEMTSDVPQFATDKTGKELDFYNWRQRGFLRRIDGRPVVLFSEEDVLEYEGGQRLESILIHEFGHVIDGAGFSEAQKQRLTQAYNRARLRGLWMDGRAAQRFRRVTGAEPVRLLDALVKSFPEQPGELLKKCLDGGDILVNGEASHSGVEVTGDDKVLIVFGGEKQCYASRNRAEYWAEGVQCWYDTNRTMDHDHNHIHTREGLEAYDPGLAALCRDILGEHEWRFVSPRERAGEGHLEGFDPETSPKVVDLPHIKAAANDYYDKYWSGFWNRLREKHGFEPVE